MNGNSMRVSLQFAVWLFTGKLLIQIYAPVEQQSRQLHAPRKTSAATGVVPM
jgi:hypothetical protein